MTVERQRWGTCGVDSGCTKRLSPSGATRSLTPSSRSASAAVMEPEITPRVGSSVPTKPAFLASALIGVYLYYGFEACGDVAEEVRDPRAMIPRAMRMTIYVGGVASFMIVLALLLAVPDFGAVISGKDPDPVTSVLKTAFGSVGFRIVLDV